MVKPTINVVQAPSSEPTDLNDLNSPALPTTPRTMNQDLHKDNQKDLEPEDKHRQSEESLQQQQQQHNYPQDDQIPLPSLGNGHTRTHSFGNSHLNYQKNHLSTPSYSFGLGFLPSFQFNSPRNINLLNSLSPQRFFQVSNSLNKAVSAKKDTDKNIFNANAVTPSKGVNNKFLDSLSMERSRHDSDDSTQEDSALWSINEGESRNLTSLTTTFDHDHHDRQSGYKKSTPPQHNSDGETNKGETPTTSHTPRRSLHSENEFLTPKRLFLNKPTGSGLRKRRLSVDESPNTSIASKIETIASPPRSSRDFRKLSAASSSSFKKEDKLWSQELDDILLSSYLKFKAFKKNNSSELTILKDASQNKVLSRMLLNKAGVLRTPKQIASRLYKVTNNYRLTTQNDHTVDSKHESPKNSINSSYSKQQSHSILDESPLLNDEIDEIIRTPLEDLIGSSSANLDTVGSAEINAKIDKELDLIFSPNELQASPLPIDDPFKLKLVDLQINYYQNYTSQYHYFSKLNNKASNLTRSQKASTNSLVNNLKLNELNNDKLTSMIIDGFENKDIPVYQITNHLNLNMKSNHNTDKEQYFSLDSVISNSNPLDLDKGSINSYMKLSVSRNESDQPFLSWKCISRIFNEKSLLFTSNDPISGFLNESNTFDVTVPFLKNFFTGFLSLLINGNDDKDLLKNINIVQIIYSDTAAVSKSQIKLCIVHRFNKLNHSGISSIQLLKFSGNRDDFDELDEDTQADVDKSMTTRTESNEDRDNDNKVNENDDDNETVLADSSPIRNLDSPRKHLRIDLSMAKNNIIPGPATAPIYNPKVIQMANNSALSKEIPKQPMSALAFPQHSQSATNIPTINNQQQIEQRSPHTKTPFKNPLSSETMSPFNTSQFDLVNSNAFSMNTGMTGMATSTPTKSSFHTTPMIQHGSLSQPLSQPQSQIRPQHQQTNYPNNTAMSQMGFGAVSSTSQQGIQGQQFQRHNSMPYIPPSQQQLMVNLGNGYVPFKSLPASLQEKYMEVQRQFQLQQQQQLLIQQQQQQQQQNMQMNSSFSNQQISQPLQSMVINQANPPVSAPASQSNFSLYNDHRKGSNKENNRPIKFGPMLEYDPSKDSATAAASAQAKAKAKKVSKPGVSVLNIPRDTPVHIYKPPKS